MVGFAHRAVYSKARNQKKKGPSLFRLERELVFISPTGGRIVVPAGFLSDLGSIPRWLWIFIPRDSYPSAFFLHDFLCEQKDRPRIQIDLILVEALLLSGAPKWVMNMIYYGVRLYALLWRIK